MSRHRRHGANARRSRSPSRKRETETNSVSNFFFFLNRNFLLGQILPGDLEITPGAILSGLLILSVLTASMSVIAMWCARAGNRQPVIPAASRTVVQIPLWLTTFGMFIACLMAVMAVLVSGGVAESEFDVPTVPAKDSAESQIVGKVRDDAPEADQPSKITAAQMAEALQHTVTFDIALLFVLGCPVYLLQRRRAVPTDPEGSQRGLVTAVGQPPGGTALQREPLDADYPLRAPAAVANTVALSSQEQWSTAPEPAPAPVGLALDSPAVTKSSEQRSAERWRFGTEFRYATETFLAAWLPTAALRVLVVVLTEENVQHPFLELMEQGVDFQILLLIALTAVVLAPLMEELLYRVIILGGLLYGDANRRRMSAFTAIATSSLLFAFAHGFPDSLALLPLAVALAWLYIQRRSYRTVILVHLLFNSFNIIVAGLGML